MNWGIYGFEETKSCARSEETSRCADIFSNDWAKKKVDWVRIESSYRAPISNSTAETAKGTRLPLKQGEDAWPEHASAGARMGPIRATCCRVYRPLGSTCGPWNLPRTPKTSPSNKEKPV